MRPRHLRDLCVRPAEVGAGAATVARTAADHVHDLPALRRGPNSRRARHPATASVCRMTRGQLVRRTVWLLLYVIWREWICGQPSHVHPLETAALLYKLLAGADLGDVR
jgi:hypothetical protein